jgi:hypothetical protein
MDSVIDYIKNNFQKKECEYFDQDYNDDCDELEILLKKIIEKLKINFSTDFEIIETAIYDSRTSISIKFVYKTFVGILNSTYCSRGYDYWCVDFMGCDE